MKKVSGFNFANPDQTTHLNSHQRFRPTTHFVSDSRMTPRASERGGSIGLSPTRPVQSKQQPLPTPPPSESPPDMSILQDKELPDPPNDSVGEMEGGKGGTDGGEGNLLSNHSFSRPGRGRGRLQRYQARRESRGTVHAGVYSMKPCRLVQPSFVNLAGRAIRMM